MDAHSDDVRASLRQQLDPAVEELIAAGFLRNCEYQGRGKATEIVAPVNRVEKRSCIGWVP